MRVIQNINNNVAVCLDDNNHEVVAFGKGIGFKKAPYEVALSQIDRTYYNLEPHYIALLNELPEDVMDVTFEIVQKGSSFLKMEFNAVLWFSLCDHINFAIQNTKKGLVLSNPMTNEIRHLYEREMRLGGGRFSTLAKDCRFSFRRARQETLPCILSMRSNKYSRHRNEMILSIS